MFFDFPRDFTFRSFLIYNKERETFFRLSPLLLAHSCAFLLNGAEDVVRLGSFYRSILYRQAYIKAFSGVL